MENDAVEAVLLLDTPWYRLWPLELACRAGKPVFCAAALELDDAHADRLHQQVQDSRLPVLMELAPRLAPATARLRELLDQQLGPPRLLVCDLVLPRHRPRQTRASRPAFPLGDVRLAVVDWCTSLVNARPVSLRAEHSDAPAYAHLHLEYAEGPVVSIRARRTHKERGSLRLAVEAERGSVEAAWPSWVSWTSSAGQHALTLARAEPLGKLLLDRFYRVVREGEVAEPSLDAAYQVLGWLRAAARSQVEGRRVLLEGSRL
jgi:predicted dehydrogenase